MLWGPRLGDVKLLQTASVSMPVPAIVAAASAGRRADGPTKKTMTMTAVVRSVAHAEANSAAGSRGPGFDCWPV